VDGSAGLIFLSVSEIAQACGCNPEIEAAIHPRKCEQIRVNLINWPSWRAVFEQFCAAQTRSTNGDKFTRISPVHYLNTRPSINDLPAGR